ncbi:MAG: hydrogenase expression/formation protein HypE [Acutalibacteraceae bacterium]|nr:hydrogenase expression/formation protein HypE [Acutalibacteraceae bacterium]
MKITLAHGSGGQSTKELIEQIFAASYKNPVLDMMEDSAVVDGSAKIAVTTDSFVVDPVFFRGGNIGRLAVCGTVNDLLMRGAVPKYITSAFIIEEGADTKDLKLIAAAMAQAAKEAGVQVVAGDTKVINGNGGIYINTAGVGFVEGEDFASHKCQKDDAIIVSGSMGDHHAAILSHRMGIKNDIKSDVAPLGEMVQSLRAAGVRVHAMRDITRGGLGTVLNELADASGYCFEVNENAIPVNADVKAFVKLLGLNIMHMGNEGKLVAIVAKEDCDKALSIIKQCKYGENASVIGNVTEGSGVVMNTALGGKKKVGILIGEGLPRIC